MEKAFEMGKTSATGSFQLLVGVAVSTIIMAVNTIILQILLSRDMYGLYGIVLVPSVLINLFRDLGLNSAMTRYIAGLRASKRDEEIHEFIVTGLIFETVSGIAFSLLSLFLASVIASTFFHRPEPAASCIEILSISIIAGSLLAASQAGFIGFERMELNSFTLICQAIVKTAVSLTLVFLGYSIFGAVIGYTVGYVAAGAIGLATFYVFLLRPLRKKLTRNPSAHATRKVTKTLRTMLEYGMPISIGTALAGILTYIYAFMIIPLTSNAVYADYVVASYFAVLLTFFTTPIATVLFPAFAKLDSQKEPELVKNVFTSSIKYSSILVVPATMALMALSDPIVGTLFGEKYVNAPFFLTISVVSTLLITAGTLSATGFLSGLGETGTIMKQNIITIIVGIPLGIILIPAYGITGLIIAGILALVPSTIWVLHWIWRKYEAKADFKSSAKILAASAIAALLAYVPTAFLNQAHWIKLVIGLIIFLAVYVLGAPIMGAVSLTDINSLRTMFSSLGIITRIMNVPLNAAEKAAKLKPANKKTDKKT